MTLKVRTLSGLGGMGSVGALGALSPSSLKAALNILEVATGQSGRYNAGPASSNSLSGDAGFHVFRATYHLIIDATDCGGQLTSLAANLGQILSSTLGDALSFVDDATRALVGQIGSALKKLDSSVANSTVGYLIWLADQVFENYLEDFLVKASVEIAALAELYLSVREFGQCGGVIKPTIDPRLAPKISITDSPIIGLDPHDPDTPIDHSIGNPTAKSKISPVVVVGGAVAIAAAIILTK